MSSRPSFASAAFEIRHQRQMPGRHRRHADDVHVVLDRLARGLVGRCEQRPDVDVEAEIGERRGDHLLAAVVAVLAHLGDEDARAAAVVLLEGGRHLDHAADVVAHVARLRSIDARDGADLGAVAGEDLLHRVRHLADGCFGARGLDAEVEQIGAAGGALGERLQRGLGLGLLALAAQALKLGDLLLAHGLVVDLQELDLGVVLHAQLVDADDGLLAASRCAPACARPPPRCGSSGCRRRSPWPCRRAARPRRCGRAPSAPARR